MVEKRKYPDFADRLNSRMEQVDIGITKLKDSLGVTYEMVRRYTMGEALPRTKVMNRLADILECEASWLQYGVGDDSETVNTKGMVPVISWVAAGNWSNIDDPFEPGTADRWLPCPVKHSDNTFALKVTGLSMYNPHGKPSFEDGDIIYVDPTVPAVNKSCVVVRMEGDQTATFKQLIIDSGKRYLKPLNPEWPDKIIAINGEATICGVVIGKWVDM